MPDRQENQRRLSFDRDPVEYAVGRPPYPSQIFDLLARDCALGSECDVLEIGPGTGQATDALLAAGASVVAVEPGPRLADHLRERFPGQKLRVIDGDIEQADISPGAYRLCVAATSLHWVNLPVALPRIAAALTADGVLAAWWTVYDAPDQPPTAFRTALDALYVRHLPGEVREPGLPLPMRTPQWQARLAEGGWFEPAQVDTIRWTNQLTPTSARRLWATFPNVAELAPGSRKRFLDAIAATVDDLGGLVDDPCVTIMYRARRRVPAS
ncbi:SAM-dependent methyltransferase [Hamadaea flava]|uniref:Class I SAM-dependent methyltransferase n=1 Tax=Hamadaea flava TaxID=1742688 RepID=A0ABV8LLC0_9ACTN|nr:class I SAM-dependent methyltransferase [Hamadaea flava]MCP2323538.1 SAM-dependent methyltransferase [Hamadaea flava]